MFGEHLWSRSNGWEPLLYMKRDILKKEIKKESHCFETFEMQYRVRSNFCIFEHRT